MEFEKLTESEKKTWFEYYFGSFKNSNQLRGFPRDLIIPDFSIPYERSEMESRTRDVVAIKKQINKKGVILTYKDSNSDPDYA